MIGEGAVSPAVYNGELTFPASMSGYLSVFCASGRAEGVTLSGLKYGLSGGTFTGSVPLGVSNEFTDAQARVAVEDGTLLVLWQGENVSESLLRTL